MILADDLGHGDLGAYGQKLITTPRIDQLAAEGLRFTDAYSTAAVCAPSRCSLLTGLHTGHSAVRANPSGAPGALKAGDTTFAEVLRTRGYDRGDREVGLRTGGGRPAQPPQLPWFRGVLRIHRPRARARVLPAVPVAQRCEGDDRRQRGRREGRLRTPPTAGGRWNATGPTGAARPATARRSRSAE
ncbi:sulfatase-like hydrolase/transferase [Streptomyces sp. MB09-01]|nr:sulfatase-like hydrolase/transferase [Streptomyces sp. MB09-01]